MLSFFTFFALVHIALATPWRPTIRGCLPILSSNGSDYRLQLTVKQQMATSFVRCDYAFQDGDSTLMQYCFYDENTNALTHYPNTPLPVDSNPNCPSTLGLAGNYVIKSSTPDPGPGKCITMTSNTDGAPLQLSTCDGRHNYPIQKWHFNGSTMVLVGTNKCIDVKDGVNANGVKLQVWTCVDGARNQQFSHAGGNVVVLPRDRMSWLANGGGLCVDRTDGKDVDGTPIQLWACDSSNPNQEWILVPTS